MKKRKVLEKMASVFVEAKKEKQKVMSNPQPVEEEPYLGHANIRSKDIVKGQLKAIPGDKVKGIFEGDIEDHRVEKTKEGDKVTIGLRIKKLLIK